MRTLVVRRLLLREVLKPDAQHVGILMPPSVGAVVVNAAVTLAHKVAANLNYTASSAVLNACLERGQIRQVLTSRRVADKLNLDLDAEMVYLEDLLPKVGMLDKAISAWDAYVLPAGLLDKKLGLDQVQPDDLLTLIFTSGSTGTPKGVMLSYDNVGSNVAAIVDIVLPKSTDTILGILPFFHSLGYMVTLWGVLSLDIRATYHFTPLDPKTISKLARKHKATILLATPTFLRTYTKRCETDDFASLDSVVSGAERLPAALADAFENKFGVRPVEGYGTTELSPLVSVNVPPSRSSGTELDCKEGTVGRAISDVHVKTIDPDTGEDLPVGRPGMLCVKGPNVMKGYYGQPDKTAEVIQDGWYKTGDIAVIDEDGFITITGRLSRFSKIGGEMVPHLNVEERVQEIVSDGDEDEVLAVVTAVPDAKKGERLVVIHRSIAVSPEDICKRLSADGLPSLWVPSVDSFVEVDEIPLLGSGKVDLKAITECAKKHFGDR